MGISGAKPVKIYQWNATDRDWTKSEREVVPTDTSKNNPSTVLTFVSGNLSTIVKTIGSTTYTKTFTHTGGNLTGISIWS